MNNSSCTVVYKPALIVLSSCNGATLVACVIALALVWHFKLYRRSVYRLALYQNLAALELAIVLIVQIQFLNYDARHHTLCIATAYFFVQSQWTKLFLVMWVTIHLFCFAVFHKNLQKFEPLYVLSSLLLPSAIAAVPLATHSYGLAGSWCWIRVSKYDCTATTNAAGLIEQFALWFAPSMIILLVTSAAMIVMLFVLIARSCPRSENNSTVITGKYQNRKALKQLLPLAAYPLIFCIFNILPFINRVYEAMDGMQK